MSHMTRMLLTEGSAAAKAGDNADARRYLERLFRRCSRADECDRMLRGRQETGGFFHIVRRYAAFF